MFVLHDFLTGHMKTISFYFGTFGIFFIDLVDRPSKKRWLQLVVDIDELGYQCHKRFNVMSIANSSEDEL